MSKVDEHETADKPSTHKRQPEIPQLAELASY